MFPINPICTWFVRALQILTVEIGIMAFRVPPSTLKRGSAIVWPLVIIRVFSRKRCSIVYTQRVTWNVTEILPWNDNATNVITQKSIFLLLSSQYWYFSVVSWLVSSTSHDVKLQRLCWTGFYTEGYVNRPIKKTSALCIEWTIIQSQSLFVTIFNCVKPLWCFRVSQKWTLR